MDLSHALKAGILPSNASLVEVILIAHREGLHELLRDQIREHCAILEGDIGEIRKKYCVPYSKYTEIPLSSTELRSRKIYKPVDDSFITTCYKCNGAFGLLNRKHHCRACGRIFCNPCSQWM